MYQKNKALLGMPVAKAMLEEVSYYLSKQAQLPQMAIVLVGRHPSSMAYVDIKVKQAEKLGITCELLHFSENVTQKELLKTIEELNERSEITGYIIQLPLPDHLDTTAIVDAIDPKKDIDGFTSSNAGKLYLERDHESYLLPATSEAVMQLLSYYHIDVSAKDVTLVGKGLVTGKPIALLLMYQNATVTVTHVATTSLKQHTKKADIIVTATGVKHLITPSMIKRGSILIDVGFTKERKTISGDIHPRCYAKASAYAPVPGGVGPVTVASLFHNLIKAHRLYT